MKKIFFIVYIIIWSSSYCSANKMDTISFYWVYYNDSVLARLNQNMEGSGYVLNVKRTEIKIKDSISIRSATDMGRSAFQTVTIKDASNHILKTVTIKQTDKNSYWIPFAFSLNYLLSGSLEKSEKDFLFYGDNKLIFKLHVE